MADDTDLNLDDLEEDEGEGINVCLHHPTIPEITQQFLLRCLAINNIVADSFCNHVVMKK